MLQIVGFIIIALDIAILVYINKINGNVLSMREDLRDLYNSILEEEDNEPLGI